MRVNIKNTKTMAVRRKGGIPNVEILFDGQEVKQVSKFVY